MTLTTSLRAALFSLGFLVALPAPAALVSMGDQTLEIQEVGAGTLVSHSGESLVDFLKRVGPDFRAFTLKTGFEACSKIWQNPDSGLWAVRPTTTQAHIGCVITNWKPEGEGWVMTHDSVHSHPVRESYRVNEADAWFQGNVVPVGTRSHTDGDVFSSRDFRAGSGYLVAPDDHLLYQHGFGTASDLGALAQAGS